MPHRFFLAWLNNNPASTTYLNTNSVPSRAAILDRLHTPGDHQISIKSQLWLPPRAYLKTGCQDREDCEPPRPIGHREVTDHLAISVKTLG